MNRLLLICALASSLVVAAPAFGAEPERVAMLLDQQKIKYEVDKDKDYKIVFEFDADKRTQIVYVSGAVEELDGMKIRTVFAPAALVDKNPIGDRMKSLLEYNGKSKVGAYELDGNILYFASRMVEPFTGEELKAMLNVIASVADDMEKEISGDKDEL